MKIQADAKKFFHTADTHACVSTAQGGGRLLTYYLNYKLMIE